MIQCVALLRGIGPGNPNMRNEHLRRVSEEIGLECVSTVISSGNVVFSAHAEDLASLEGRLERAWRERLGFESSTIIRTRAELETLVSLDPFGGLAHGKETYLLVTFAKEPLSGGLEDPPWADDAGFRIVAVTEREVFTATDTTALRTPDTMLWAERHLGKEITSRTWLTVARILKRMG